MIDANLSWSVSWERLEDRKGSRIALRRTGMDPAAEDRWPEYFNWYLKAVEELRTEFTDRIRELDIEALSLE